MRHHLVNMALDQAHMSQMQMRHGALVINTRTGQVVSAACNRMGSTKRTPGQTWSVHAEVAALIQCRRCKDLSVLVVRVSNRGLLMYSKPCSDCCRVMKLRGVETCYYTNHNGDLDVINIQSPVQPP